MGKGGSGVSDSTRLQFCGPVTLFSLWGAQSRPTMWLPKVPGCCQKAQGGVLGKTKSAVRAEAGEAVLSSAEVFLALL